MKRKHPSLRQFGQTSLPSSFLSRSPGVFRVPNEDGPSKPSKQSVSLSEFLDRKLIKTTSKSIKEKQNSFSSIGSANKECGSKRDEDGDKVALDEAIFRQFNRSASGGIAGNSGDVGVGESQLESTGDGQDSGKRRKAFGIFSGEAERRTTPEHMVVLGDDPQPRPKRRAVKFTNGRDKDFYNHYANGCGWWDCDREGVDSEEVGFNEVWEGVGSTTLGGLEWH